MSDLNRDEALERLVNEVIEWDGIGTNAPKLSSPNIWKTLTDGGWIFISGIFYRNTFNHIEYKDWLEAKEKTMDNKELMMKAAVQFNGVWPTDRATHLVTTSKEWNGGKEYTNQINTYTEEGSYFIGGEFDGISPRINEKSWEIFCTRDQFESFVESLFEGAPEGTTHSSKTGGFYKVINTVTYFFDFSKDWILSCNTQEWLEKNLIQRPVTKNEPEVPYIPKVGEECEALYDDALDLWFNAVILSNSFNFVGRWQDGPKKGSLLDYSSRFAFRPLRTEHDQLLDALVNRMMNHYSNPKGAEGYKGLAEAILSDESLSIISVSNQK